MKKLLSVIFIIFTSSICIFADIVVAKDGSGDFTSIQAALNSIAVPNTTWTTIVVKNGIYDEHVMIKTGYIALVGESRSQTRIEHNISRTSWNKGGGNGSNIGTGVINIASGVSNVVIANLYIRNTYEESEDYTEVIRSETGTTKLWVMNCNVLALWKDTFAPWGKAGGMYYVSDCTFRGSIDAFCPRGYCYAINNRYIETKSSSPIWHEGVAQEDQKLVIQGGSVHSEYNKNVKLQNAQNYAKFYYLDVRLSDSITQLGNSSPTWFYGVKGKSDLSWFSNNLTLSDRKQIDAKWTFQEKWDPENTLPQVLPFASMPQPYNGRYALGTDVLQLKWVPARDMISQKIYLGKNKQPDFLAETTENVYQVDTFEPNTTYYWKVNTVTSEGETDGAIWCFSTGDTIDDLVIPEDPGNPETPDNTDYESSRLNTYETTLSCKTMPKEPAWITKAGSVNWTSGTGYRWGSSSAVLTLKVSGCTEIACAFTNGSTSRPIIITDGNNTNDVTAYPSTANAESTVRFYPFTTGDADFQIKTSGSSGLTITKIVFYGVKSSMQIPADETLPPFFTIRQRLLETTGNHLLDVFDVSGRCISRNILRLELLPGVYCIKSGFHSGKAIVL